MFKNLKFSMRLMILPCDRNQILPPSLSCTLLLHISTNAIQFTHEKSLGPFPFWLLPHWSSLLLVPYTPNSLVLSTSKSWQSKSQGCQVTRQRLPGTRKNQSYSVPNNYLGKYFYTPRPKLYSARKSLQNFFLSPFLPSFFSSFLPSFFQ